VVNKQRERVRI